MSQWEHVDAYTKRLSVPGGWLYEVCGEGDALALVFVPEAPTVRVRKREDGMFVGTYEGGSEELIGSVDWLRGLGINVVIEEASFPTTRRSSSRSSW